MPKSQVTERAQSEGNMELDCAGSAYAKRIRARAYVFTWFGAQEHEINKFIRTCEEKGWKYILGNEICPETQRQHWQGYINFGGSQVEKITMNKLINGGWNKIAKGNPWSNWEYCTKDGEIKTNIERKEIIPEIMEVEEQLDMWRLLDRKTLEWWINRVEERHGVIEYNCSNVDSKCDIAKLLSIKTKAIIVENDKKAVVARIMDMYKEHKKKKHVLEMWRLPNLIVMHDDKSPIDWLNEIARGIVVGPKETIIGLGCTIIIMEMKYYSPDDNVYKGF